MVALHPLTFRPQRPGLDRQRQHLISEEIHSHKPMPVKAAQTQAGVVVKRELYIVLQPGFISRLHLFLPLLETWRQFLKLSKP